MTMISQTNMIITDLQGLYEDIITMIDNQSVTEQAIILLVLVCVFLLQTSSISYAGETKKIRLGSKSVCRRYLLSSLRSWSVSGQVQFKCFLTKA